MSTNQDEFEQQPQQQFTEDEAMMMDQQIETPQAPAAIELPLEEAMKRIMDQPNIRGVLVSDKEGLCVGSQGFLLPINSGRLTNLYSAALKMAPDNAVVGPDGNTYFVPEQPIIIIETLHGQLVLNNIDTFTTTIAYANPNNNKR